MTVVKQPSAELDFLDMQALVGITKHIGGLAATDELLDLCHVEAAQEVLNVGCGIGAGVAYVAKRHNCRVVGADISEQMIAWSRQRARQERVADRVEFRTADVLDLPFDNDRFDLVYLESVLIFVEDKVRAIEECVRVTRPGGYVGLNEGMWLVLPPPELVDQVIEAIGPYIPTRAAWEALWADSGLQERLIKVYPYESAQEIKSRIAWIGWRWLLRAWGRGLRLYLTKPAIRQPIKNMLSLPTGIDQYIGYGLFCGRK